MTTKKKIAANRTNAKRSSGPRTAAGKARASRNAHRHGLAAIAFHNPAFTDEIGARAQAICGTDKSPHRLAQALIIAESQIIVTHVRLARALAIARAIMPAASSLQDRSGDQGDQSATLEGCSVPSQPHSKLEALRMVLPELNRLERYERRALSRRARAVREFMAASSTGVQRPSSADFVSRDLIAT